MLLFAVCVIHSFLCRKPDSCPSVFPSARIFSRASPCKYLLGMKWRLQKKKNKKNTGFTLTFRICGLSQVSGPPILHSCKPMHFYTVLFHYFVRSLHIATQAYLCLLWCCLYWLLPLLYSEWEKSVQLALLTMCCMVLNSWNCVLGQAQGRGLSHRPAAASQVWFGSNLSHLLALLVNLLRPIWSTSYHQYRGFCRAWMQALLG